MKRNDHLYYKTAITLTAGIRPLNGESSFLTAGIRPLNGESSFLTAGIRPPKRQFSCLVAGICPPDSRNLLIYRSRNPSTYIVGVDFMDSENLSP